MLSVTMVIGGTITGTVTNKDSGEPLVGANVYLQGTAMGAATDAEGMFRIEAEDGTYNLVCDYVGFAKQTIAVNIVGNVNQNFELVEFLFANAIDVIADRALERQTPVAYTNVSKQRMEAELGSQDIPMVLNTTPSVYATMQGGGAGDARVNVRGFNQRNVAIMINGVPVNDMENGWVYWSNWDGVGDATSSMQIQRGLSAVNLATPSIGGTMNIITDPTAQTSGLKFKQEYGSGTFLKSTLTAHTGLIDDKYAVSATVVRKTGEGVTDKTWTDAWAWYLGASYNIDENNRLEFYALGAPQRHGQNLYRQNIGAYDTDFAKDLDDYDEAALVDYFQADADNLYPDADAEGGRLYNETWGPVSSSYKGKQAIGGYQFDRHDPDFLNERENFFHKPQVNLNWYSNLADDLSLGTVLYYSGGRGGGTGTLGSIRWNYHIGIDSPSRFPAWDATIERNMTNTDSLGNDLGSTGILRNSRNNQYTIGLISKLNYKVDENLKTTIGVDWRTAEIDHYREVRDLLGGSFYQSNDSDFWGSNGKQLGLGDKVAYYNTNTVDWLGGFVQGEYTMDQISAYGTFGFSSISYKYVDHFIMDANGGELTLESDPEYGYQIKGGAMYRIDANTEVYGNFGYIAKAPIFDSVIDDNNGIFSENPETEKFTSLEAGVNWRGLDNTLSLKGSFYYTTWADRALPRSVQTSLGVFDIVFLTGLDQVHSGIEFEAAYQPMPMFRIDLAGSIGSWEHTSDAEGDYRALDSQSGLLETRRYLLGADGLKIGDAPQTQVVLGGSVFPVEGLRAQFVFRYYDEFYSDFDVTDRLVDPDDPTDIPDRTQSWKVPSYSLLDFHASYALPLDLNGVNISIYAHAFNILDELYISDAVDNSRYNSFDQDHDADDAEVYMGLPQTFNIGLSIAY